jgi:hypothetical protein
MVTCWIHNALDGEIGASGPEQAAIFLSTFGILGLTISGVFTLMPLLRFNGGRYNLRRF